jgi:hypothetical protein
MPIEIPLPHGAVVLIDPADLAIVSPFRWGLWERKGHRYATTSMRIGDGRRGVGMHRLLLLGKVSGQTVDHIDGDGLNNQRSNLRIVSRGQNRSNSIKRREASCDFKGVYRFGHKWAAQISSRERWPSGPWRIGLFDTGLDAALAYDAVARILFGEYARVNFPRDGEQCAILPSEAATAGTMNREGAS